MNPYLRIALIHFAIAAIALILLLQGCAPTYTGVCRHEATYAISVVGERVPVRVAVGKIRHERHAQAQAFISGEWRYLAVKGREVFPGSPDGGFVVTGYYHPVGWLRQVNQWMIQENKMN